LLHEGRGERSGAAEVKIIISDTTGRLAEKGSAGTAGDDGGDVVISRTVGVKKDEYFISGKAVKKGDVTALLETAGFSKSNPYYIVAQGKVSALATMTDFQRLCLLKEVAGTQVYEDRRKESLGILEETGGKRAQIDEVLGEIDNRIAELDAETEELTQYLSLDKQRRALEYMLYSSELSKAVEELEELARAKEEVRDIQTHMCMLFDRQLIGFAMQEGKAAAGYRDQLEHTTAALSTLEAEYRNADEELRAKQAAKQSGTYLYSTSTNTTHTRINTHSHIHVQHTIPSHV
jgi:structural maintenance of chromosome 3 (chondroitin sulfate proteoglycan 6)